MEDSREYRTVYRNEYEETVGLKDMLFHVLYRWRSLLMAALTAACLAGGYASVYNRSILPEKNAEVQTRLEEALQLQQLIQQQAEGGGQDSVQTALQTQGKTADQVKKEIEAIRTELGGLKELSPARYAVIGFATGVFLMAICYAASYALSDKMRGERELRDRYGWNLLGVIPKGRRKGLLKGIDRLLERLEGTSDGITEEEAYRIIAVNITNLRKDGGAFLVTGTVQADKLRKLSSKLLPQLQENTALMTEADMNANADTLAALAECDGVVLVEERDRSLRAKVQREQESIEALGKAVVGYVVW